jgi:hypothetical protein
MQPLSFRAWLASLGMVSSTCIHLPSNHMSLFLMPEGDSIVYIYHIFLMNTHVCMIFLMCCWIQLVNILLRIFASMFIKEIGL